MILFCLICPQFFPCPPGVAAAGPFEFVDARAISVDTHAAVVEWVTTVPTNGRIDYGENLRDANRVALAIDVDTTHRTALFGLREGEDHVFRVFASDTSGRQIRTNWGAFRTLGVPAPRIERVDVQELSWRGGRVVWVSNIPVKGFFECGYDTGYGYSKKESAYGTIHDVDLDRFSPRKTIHYRITATDHRGKSTPPHLSSFRTAEHNLAAGAAVRGTFVRNPDASYITDSPPILTRVTDGTTSYFKGMATSGDPAKEEQWVEIDFGRIHDVSEILTFWRRLAYPKKFSLSGSLDGERWYEFGDTHTADSGAGSLSETGDPIYIHTAAIGQYALRYIRLHIPRGAPIHKKFDNYNFVQLFELKAYPPEIEDGFMRMLRDGRERGRKGDGEKGR
ncbi:discoidin domain-containing protein [bacterium]|nr:discoidin domain-containing protein [bacterium]